MKLKTLITTLGIGAGLMYFLDPQHGERRRTMVRNKANQFVNDIDESLDIAMQDARNRARGVLSEMTARLSDEQIPDWILEERVRSNLGRTGRYTRGINIRAENGRIYLTGPVLGDDQDTLIKAAMRTRGVHGVENQFQVFDNAQDIPALQNAAATRGQTTSMARHNWSPSTRLLSGVGGSLLTLYGLTRKGVAKPVLGTAGLVLTARGLTNLQTRSLLGLGLGERGIQVQKAINIFAPVDEVYQFWRNFENFPLFMNHVNEISVEENGNTSHWTVKGPADSPYHFTSQITQDIPNELIAWETLPDSEIHSAGFVRFDENRDGSTRVTVQMSYIPPVGVLGHAVAQLFGVDPRQAMHDDLIRLKTLLEEGKTSTDENTVEYVDRGAMG
jgi:uncharacterized membrane protein